MIMAVVYRRALSGLLIQKTHVKILAAVILVNKKGPEVVLDTESSSNIHK